MKEDADMQRTDCSLKYLILTARKYNKTSHCSARLCSRFTAYNMHGKSRSVTTKLSNPGLSLHSHNEELFHFVKTVF